jgi:RHS repeat-associated protein
VACPDRCRDVCRRRARGDWGPTAMKMSRRRFSGQTRIGRYRRARCYHPGLQLFASEDPIRLETGPWNLYGYVDNNPLTYVDPLGLERERRGCGTRDYVSLGGTLAVLNPVTGTLLSGVGQLTVDRYGQIYLGAVSRAAGLSSRLSELYDGPTPWRYRAQTGATRQVSRWPVGVGGRRLHLCGKPRVVSGQWLGALYLDTLDL